MSSPHGLIEQLDWNAIGTQLDAEGYAMLPGLLATQVARDLARQIPARKAAPAREAGAAESGGANLHYPGAGLPAPLDRWRTSFYRHLQPIANRWRQSLGTGPLYPAELEQFIQLNRQAGQCFAQSHLNRLLKGDHMPLHQCKQGEQVFPMQIVALLSRPGVDFRGGHFVLTEQRPRMQSRPMVLPLRQGDAAIIATATRPFKGSQGIYRVNLKHAVGRVLEGERCGLELSFHHAP